MSNQDGYKTFTGNWFAAASDHSAYLERRAADEPQKPPHKTTEELEAERIAETKSNAVAERATRKAQQLDWLTRYGLFVDALQASITLCMLGHLESYEQITGLERELNEMLPQAEQGVSNAEFARRVIRERWHGCTAQQIVALVTDIDVIDQQAKKGSN